MHRMDKADTVLLIYEKEDCNRQLHQALLDLPIPLSLSLSPSDDAQGRKLSMNFSNVQASHYNNEIMLHI